MLRKALLALALVAAPVLAGASCESIFSGPIVGSGLVDEAWYQSRIADYLGAVAGGVRGRGSEARCGGEQRGEPARGARNRAAIRGAAADRHDFLHDIHPGKWAIGAVRGSCDGLRPEMRPECAVRTQPAVT